MFAALCSSNLSPTQEKAHTGAYGPTERKCLSAGVSGRALKQEHLDYSNTNDDTAAEPQDTAAAPAELTREQIFALALGLVEQMYATTEDERVALLQLRVALTVCALCPVPPELQDQKHLQPVFALDGDLDRQPIDCCC